MKHYYKILKLIYGDFRSSESRIHKYCTRINNSSNIIKLSFHLDRFIVNRIDGLNESKSYEIIIDVVSEIRDRKINSVIY